MMRGGEIDLKQTFSIVLRTSTMAGLRSFCMAESFASACGDFYSGRRGDVKHVNNR